MAQEAITALIAGVLLGSAYAVASYLMSKRALEVPKRFMVWVLGGTVARMAVALVAAAVVFVTLPVHRAIFLGTFLSIVVLALAIEITLLHRKAE